MHEDNEAPDVVVQAELRGLPPLLRCVTEVCDKQGWTGESVKGSLKFSTLLDLLPRGVGVAIASGIATGAKPITHGRLRDFVEHEFNLSAFGLGRADRCGLVLPNGPYLGLALVGVASRCCCAPANIQNTPEEVVAELTNVNCKMAIIPQFGTLEVATAPLTALAEALRHAGIKIIFLTPNAEETGIFTLEADKADEGEAVSIKEGTGDWTQRGDVVLVLHTSGTSGKKKVVPYSLETLCVGAACVVASWALGPTDVCMNMMPLYHVGGIVRNLLAVLLSGGCVVLAKGFDPQAFWEIVGPTGTTWYYAGPTMHHMILQAAAMYPEEEGPPANRIRLICNAAGGLLPSLAQQLLDCFVGCTVLPSYGMTECMPISSPPIGYKLDRPGTSGKMCGPEMCILDDSGEPVAPDVGGNVCVRGSPLFDGYEGDPKATKEAHFAGGWFNTGDVGRMDAEGWLYITGRSKEVINRGGEIISPFEVEEVMLGHPRVAQVAAFSMPHVVLQEVVGVVIVSEPGQPRVGLSALQKYAAAHLHPTKWPQVVIYMNDLPKGQTNKLLRIGLAQRCDIAHLTDATPAPARHLEAVCPPKGASLKSPIATTICQVDVSMVATALAAMSGMAESTVVAGKMRNHPEQLVAYAVAAAGAGAEITAATVLAHLEASVHGYMLPHHVVILPSPLPRTADGAIDSAALPVPGQENADKAKKLSRTERILQKIWGEVLSEEGIGVDVDFFMAGGSSLQAGVLVSKVRKATGVSLSGATIFEYRTITTLAAEIDRRRAAEPARPASDDSPGGTKSSPKRDGLPLSLPLSGVDPAAGGPAGANASAAAAAANTPPKNPPTQKSVAALLTQLVSAVVFMPLYHWTYFVLWVAILSGLRGADRTIGRSVNNGNDISPWQLFLSILIVHFGLQITMPIVAIIFKWCLIGRYKKGKSPLWGSLYLRWWLCKQFQEITGKGIFSGSDFGVATYHRLMGAKIGRGARISSKTVITEHDLVTIGANACVDGEVVISPFHMEAAEGVMSLLPIVLGDDCALCAKVIVAAGHTLPDGTCLGPCSSSHELADASPENRQFCRAAFPAPSIVLQLVLGAPIILGAHLAHAAPWIAYLFLLFSRDFFSIANVSFLGLLEWFGADSRLVYYLCLRQPIRAVISPFFYVLYCILIKRLVVGRFVPGPRGTGQWQLFRHWIMARLLPGGTLHRLSYVIGTHYELVSVVYRMLGAKIGKRVYWPGSGLLGLSEYDLLEVGDDVVFGSRSSVIPVDAKDAATIKLGDGCMVADRSVLLPGFTMERNSLLGTGSLGAKNLTLPPASKWLGSVKGAPVCLSRGTAEEAERSTLRPYGKAFYQRNADFFVMHLWMHVLYNTTVLGFGAIMWRLPMFLALQATSRAENSGNVIYFLLVFLALQFLFTGALTVVMLFMDVGFKWLIMGRRMPGSYNWDKSSYCQRWQLLIQVHGAIRLGEDQHLLEHFAGSAYMVWYYRALGATIGNGVCLYPNYASPPMTEPDVVTIGDFSCIDDASLIGHINSLGEFSLSKLTIGAGTTLRRGTRVLSGAGTEEDATLLEHTLVVSGDIVNAGATWQGWPAEVVIPGFTFAMQWTPHSTKAHTGMGKSRSFKAATPMGRSFKASSHFTPRNASAKGPAKGLHSSGGPQAQAGGHSKTRSIQFTPRGGLGATSGSVNMRGGPGNLLSMSQLLHAQTPNTAAAAAAASFAADGGDGGEGRTSRQVSFQAVDSDQPYAVGSAAPLPQNK